MFLYAQIAYPNIIGYLWVVYCWFLFTNLYLYFPNILQGACVTFTVRNYFKQINSAEYTYALSVCYIYIYIYISLKLYKFQVTKNIII